MPFEVITIEGPAFQSSKFGEGHKGARTEKTVAKEIEAAYTDIKKRRGRVVGHHALQRVHPAGVRNNPTIIGNVLFLVADIPDSDIELTQQVKHPLSSS